MLRNSIPALALLALAIGFGPTARPAFAQTPAKTTSAATAQPAEPDHESAAQAHGQPNIMEPQPSLAFWTLVVFLVLMLVLARFAWKPLLHALHEREAHLEHVLLDSEKARNDAEAHAAETRKQLTLAADQARALIEEARREAKVAADAIVRDAQAAAEASRTRAEREISGAKDQALSEIYAKTADLAVSVAGRVLSRELNDSDQRRLVEVALAELPANGDGFGGTRA